MTRNGWKNTIGTVLIDLPDDMTIAQFKDLQDAITIATQTQGGHGQSWAGSTFMVFHMTEEESNLLADLITQYFGERALEDWNYHYDDDFEENYVDPMTRIHYTGISGDIQTMVSGAKCQDCLESDWFYYCLNAGIIKCIDSNVLEDYDE